MNPIFLYMIGLLRYIYFSFVCYFFYLLTYSSTTLAEKIDLLESKDITIIAFGSCNDQSLSQNFWKNIQAYKPDVFLQIGDNVYAKNKSLISLIEAYKDLKNNSYYKNFSSNTEIMGIWDDHDYGRNDGGKNYKDKYESKNIFLDFFEVNKKDERYFREGLYKEYILNYKDKYIQIIILDTRFFKSDFKITNKINAKGKERYIPDFTENKTILGDKQWEWFEEQLKKKVDLRIIVSSFQVLPKDHGWEKWGNFPLEQRKFYSLINNNNHPYTIIASGDRHFGALYKKELSKNINIYELTSSSLNKPLKFKVEENDSMQLGGLVVSENFGLISIDWAKSIISLELKSPNSTEKNSLLSEDILFNN